MMNFKIGDYVSRNSYENDVVFKIIDIKDDIPSLVAYSRISDEAWENGPSDYLNSWNFVELINTSDYVTEG